MLLPDVKRKEPPGAATASPPFSSIEPPTSFSFSPNERPPVKEMDPPLPPSFSSELSPDPADILIAPPAEAAFLAFPEVRSNAPP